MIAVGVYGLLAGSFLYLILFLLCWHVVPAMKEHLKLVLKRWRNLIAQSRLNRQTLLTCLFWLPNIEKAKSQRSFFNQVCNFLLLVHDQEIPHSPLQPRAHLLGL